MTLRPTTVLTTFDSIFLTTKRCVYYWSSARREPEEGQQTRGLTPMAHLEPPGEHLEAPPTTCERRGRAPGPRARPWSAGHPTRSQLLAPRKRLLSQRVRRAGAAVCCAVCWEAPLASRRPRGRRRQLVADDWSGWGITDAVRVALSAPATPPSVPAGPGPV
jgi:hypothetical protein